MRELTAHERAARTTAKYLMNLHEWTERGLLRKLRHRKITGAKRSAEGCPIACLVHKELFDKGVQVHRVVVDGDDIVVIIDVEEDVTVSVDSSDIVYKFVNKFDDGDMYQEFWNGNEN